MADLKKLSDEQLDEASYKLQADRDAIRQKQLDIHEERSRRASEAGEPDVAIEGVPAEGGAS
jgi:hypothetical protein